MNGFLGFTMENQKEYKESEEQREWEIKSCNVTIEPIIKAKKKEEEETREREKESLEKITLTNELRLQTEWSSALNCVDDKVRVCH